jgi:serine/threonine protein phosphatase 1
MARTYAIPDLHGRWDLLQIALAEIEGQAPGKIVFLGDYIDRGPQSRQIVECLIDGPRPGWRWICLKGNHEEMMVRTLIGGRDPGPWLGNGGDATLRSYGQPYDGSYQPDLVPVSHLLWMDSLLLLHRDVHRVYVHAGVDANLPLDAQDAHTLLWFRYPEDYAEGHSEFHVVHGHQPYEDGPLCLQGRTDLDTLAWATGRLVVGIFDDDVPGGPVDFIIIEERSASEANESDGSN